MRFRTAQDYSVLTMELHRAEQYKAAKEIAALLEQRYNRICVTAPFKAGKKEVMIGVRLLLGAADYLSKESDRIFLSVTALFRKDCREQINLLNECKVLSRQLGKHSHVERLILEIETLIGKGKGVVLFLDEVDYGSGYRQLLGRLYDFAENNSQVTVVGISATNYEMGYAKDKNGNSFPLVKFIPAVTYRGAEFFLDNDLAEEATPFLSDDNQNLSEQGEEYVQGLMESDKNFLVVRLRSGKDYSFFQSKVYKRIENKYPGLKIIFADGNKPFDWSPDETGDWHGYVNCGTKTMIVICQTCTRSTEVGFHKHIYAWHDYYDPQVTPLATALQAILRVAHYDVEGHKIRLACHVTDLQIEAGIKTKADRAGGLISSRVSLTPEGKDGPQTILKLWFDHVPSSEEVQAKFLSSGKFELPSNFQGWKPKLSHTSERSGYSGNVCASFLNDAIRSTAHVGGVAGIHFDGPSTKNSTKNQKRYHQDHLDSYAEVLRQFPNAEGKVVVLIAAIDPSKKDNLSDMADSDRFTPNHLSMFGRKKAA